MFNIGATGLRASKGIHRSMEESQSLVFGEGARVGWRCSNKNAQIVGKMPSAA